MYTDLFDVNFVWKQKHHRHHHVYHLIHDESISLLFLSNHTLYFIFYFFKSLFLALHTHNIIYDFIVINCKAHDLSDL